jgi:hypothetical protein
VDVPAPELMDVGEAVRRIVRALRARRAFVAFPARTAWQAWLLRHVPLALSDWMTHRYWVECIKKRQATA